MSQPENVVWERLRELDDPVNVERPAGFDEDAAANRFRALTQRLERDFGCRCRADAGPNSVQDASFYGDVFIPADATKSGGELSIRVSNFGGMAVYAIELPGAYDAPETAELLDSSDRDRIERALIDTGHFVVPEDVLWREYNGTSDFWRTHFPNEAQPTWWTRFFDYL